MTDLLHRMHHDLRRLARENERLREEVANAATAERARLAGMAPDDMRKLVCHFEDVVTDRVRETERGERYCHPDTGWDTPTRAVDVTSVRTTLLARLAAARGEDDLLPACCGEYGVKRMAYCGACPLDEALAAYVGNPAQRRIVLDRLTTLRARLAAVEGERDAAERRGAERALRWAADNRPGTGGLRDLLGAVADNPEDQWAGYVARGLATLFPPPGAEVGRG